MVNKRGREYKKIKNEANSVIIAVIALVLTILIHYFLLSGINLHSTLHVFIGVTIFFILVALFTAIIEHFGFNH